MTSHFIELLETDLKLYHIEINRAEVDLFEDILELVQNCNAFLDVIRILNKQGAADVPT